MKKFMLVLPLLFLSSKAHALLESHEVAFSSATCGQVLVSSGAASSVTAQVYNGTLAGAFNVDVYNVDATNTINCGFDTNVSTISTNAFYGREIRPQTGFTFKVNPTALPVYCATQKTSGSSVAVVTQIK